MTKPGTIPIDIEARPFDLIIVGGGINGAGIARDAAMRGLDVLLIEKHDFGSGTTPWSTRLIHGGLRYLEHGELRLVRESLRERETLLRIAPHLVRPIRFLLPVYNWHRRGPLTIQAGMIAYDLLSANKSLPRHRMMSRDETLVEAPALARDGLRRAALYHDGQVTFPERLVIENVIDAAAHGATIANHTTVTRIVVDNGRVSGVEIRAGADERSIRVNAPTIVNASGPWVDMNLAGLQARPLIGGTKGSHIVVGRFPGAPACATFAEARDDGRPFFVVPWQSWLLIGTTDAPCDGDPDEVQPTRTEIDYLISQTLAIFPGAEIGHESILFAYAGIRPLPATPGKAAGAITRRHFIRHHGSVANGLYSIVGGKLTTYRRLAEEVTDIVCRRVGHGDRCRTAETALPGAGEPTAARGRLSAMGLSRAAIDRCAELYGARLNRLADLVERQPDLATAIGPDETTVAAEVVFAIEDEFARSIGDVLLRRTMLGLRPGLGVDLLEPTLTIARDHLGWNDDRLADERRQYVTEVRRLNAL